MKAYELQIGDWVNCGGEVCQVVTISAQGFAEVIQDVDLWYVNIDNIKPVPLTDEILIANGWHQSSWVAGMFFTPRKGFEGDNLTIRKTDDGYEFTAFCHETALKYAHQFQQILRLCGYESMTQGLGIVSQ
jgi:hypothetical protein